MKKILIVFLIVFCGVIKAQEGPYELVVKVHGIQIQEGSLMIALFDSEENFLGKRLGGGSKPVNGDSLMFTFKGLSEGVYAVSIFQDINDNKKLDSNFMGIPNEPYAFSNNAKGMFGPPKFEDCKFQIVGVNKIINITL